MGDVKLAQLFPKIFFSDAEKFSYNPINILFLKADNVVPTETSTLNFCL